MLGAKNAQHKRQNVKTLNDQMEKKNHSSPDLSPYTENVLEEQKDALKCLYEIQASGALIRAHFNHIREADNYVFVVISTGAVVSQLGRGGAHHNLIGISGFNGQTRRQR